MTPELKQALNTIQNECQKNNECDSCTLYAAGLGCRVTLVSPENGFLMNGENQSYTASIVSTAQSLKIKVIY